MPLLRQRAYLLGNRRDCYLEFLLYEEEEQKQEEEAAAKFSLAAFFIFLAWIVYVFDTLWTLYY